MSDTGQATRYKLSDSVCRQRSNRRMIVIGGVLAALLMLFLLIEGKTVWHVLIVGLFVLTSFMGIAQHHGGADPSEPGLELVEGGIVYHYVHGTEGLLDFAQVARYRASGEGDYHTRLRFDMIDGKQHEIHSYEGMDEIRRHCDAVLNDTLSVSKRLLAAGESGNDGNIDAVHTSSRTFELWRQDDNGGEFLIKSFNNEADAEAARSMYEARGHKQLYWVRESVQ